MFWTHHLQDLQDWGNCLAQRRRKNGERPQRRYGFWPRNALFCAVISFWGNSDGCKRPPLTLRFKLRVIQPATCCAHIFCFSWRKFPPDHLYFTTLLGSVPKWSNLSNERCRGLSASGLETGGMAPRPPSALHVLHVLHGYTWLNLLENGERPQRRYGFWPRNAMFCAVIAFWG